MLKTRALQSEIIAERTMNRGPLNGLPTIHHTQKIACSKDPVIGELLASVEGLTVTDAKMKIGADHNNDQHLGHRAGHKIPNNLIWC